VPALVLAGLLAPDVQTSWAQQNDRSNGLDVFANASSSLEHESVLGEFEERAILAMTTPDYPVTPGDRYTLSYIHSLRTITVPIIVDHEGEVNLSVFGRIDARDMTFSELKEQVEETVRRAYPSSVPHLVIRGVGAFRVLLTGEVTRSRYVNAWGLTRLQEVLEGRLTDYASARDVRIVSSSGDENTYDIFRAQRLGEMEEDPYVRSGDTIVVASAERTVSIAGEVKRPGTYQLLPGDELRDLIYGYAAGPTKRADLGAIEVRRLDPEDETRARTIYASVGSRDRSGLSLRDRDEVQVQSALDRLPVVYLEGAFVGEPSDPQTELPGPPARAVRLAHRFSPGETLETALRSVRLRLAPTADPAQAYVVRIGSPEPMPVDLEAVLYDAGPDAGMRLEPFDRIVVPFRQAIVFVEGAVRQPGTYPYVPNRTWRYYVDLAGGLNGERNIGERVTVIDAQESRREPGEPVQPEDTVFAHTNHPLYHFERLAGILSTAISLASLVVGILQLTQ